MRRLQLIVPVIAAACGGGSSEEAGSSGSSSSSSGSEFQLRTVGDARGDHASEIEPTATHAAMRLFVVDREDGPIRGVVVKMTAQSGEAFYTEETDGEGYAEVLVPIGQRYEMEYLSLGRRNTTAAVDVPAEPNQNIRLTLRYRRWRPTPSERPPAEADAPAAEEPEGFVLEDLLFDTGRATIQQDSLARLDRVVEYMTHRPNTRIRIAGHTDNVGNAQQNQRLSESRAQAVREYIVSQGVDASRVESVGYGDTQPVAPNDTDEGRQRNRRIEAIELE